LHQQINIAGLIWNHAIALQRRYYRLIFEDLNLDGMKRLWGRKMSDLGFS